MTLSPRQAELLALICQGTTRQATMAEILDVSLATISRNVNFLVKRRLVLRKSDQIDLRNLIFAPTAKGRSIAVSGFQFKGEPV